MIIQKTLEKIIMLGKTEGSRQRGRPNLRWIDSIKETTDPSLHDLSKAVNDRTFWRTIICRVAYIRSNLMVPNTNTRVSSSY